MDTVLHLLQSVCLNVSHIHKQQSAQIHKEYTQRKWENLCLTRILVESKVIHLYLNNIKKWHMTVWVFKVTRDSKMEEVYWI